MSPRPLVFVASLLFFSSMGSPAHALLVQKGPKVAGTSGMRLGISVAVSADGKTVVAGANGANGLAGAAQVFTPSGGVWLGAGELVGTGATSFALQGTSVSLSADGTTAIVGGVGDENGAGAVWVFTRSGGVWSQQGDKLVGTGAVGAANQGVSVAVSADGNTAIVGGPVDDGGTGAAWVFTRSGGVWSQQGDKLVGNGAVGAANQGVSVAVSANGNTAIVGGNTDDTGAGAAWVFTRSGGAWSQQGDKLVGTGAVGAASQGVSVAVSGDGNTAVVGGNTDSYDNGAAWVFTRSSGVWSQQGDKWVGGGIAPGPVKLGSSVAIASDGNTIVLGGPGYAPGSTLVYTRNGGVWGQPATRLDGTGVQGTVADQGAAVAVSDDGSTVVVGASTDGVQLSLAGAVWVFARAEPVIVSALDIPGDQGGWLRLTVDASASDFVTSLPVSMYGVWRLVPEPDLSTVPALDLGTAAIPLTLDVRTKDGRTYTIGRGPGEARSTASAAFPPGTWELVASVPAVQLHQYVVATPTLSNAAPSEFVVTASTTTPSIWYISAPASGQSVDNLAPARPSGFTASYSGGQTNLQWAANAENDLGSYRLYRGTSADFTPAIGNRIATQISTTYTDAGAGGSYYKLSAVDVNGNESGFALVTPEGTTGTGDGIPEAFALAGARPNPTSGSGLHVAFALPGGVAARLELLDPNGRRVLVRDVGSLGTGRHMVDLAQGRRIAPGVYWVRLTQGANQRTTRVAVIE